MSGATICFTDACLDGMAYWFPNSTQVTNSIPAESQTHHIFYYEALAVTCVILDEHHHLLRIIFHSDNQNTVNIWHSLEATAPYNQLLILAIDGLISLNTDVCVLHVPSTSNTVMDALFLGLNMGNLWVRFSHTVPVL